MLRTNLVARFAVFVLPIALTTNGAFAGDAPVSAVQKPVNERFAPAETQEVPDFQRHILPALGKLGCNGRACHGSFQGQGGFRLSLFGYDFKMDHEALLKGDSPRVDLAEPAESSMLTKPTLNVPHKGGRRLDVDSWEYRMLTRWIEAGAKGVEDAAVRFDRLEVVPSQIVFDAKGAKQQLQVIAYWADGSSEDVTPICRYRTNNESISEVSDTGLVTSVASGDTHVVAFYDNGVAPIQTILPVSDQVGPRYPEVPTPTKIDALVVEKLRPLGVVPSDLAGDAEFLRRVSLDLTGTLPTPAEIEAFLADAASDKRSRKINELLERPAYAAWWATRLCDITGNNPQTLDEQGLQNEMARQWYDWTERRVRENMPYDQIVSRIFVAASREPGQDYNQYVQQMASYFRKEDPADFTARETMPHYWARRTFRTPEDRALGFAYAFLGVRLQCAQCHKHPFDQWTQEDFNQFKAFFSQVNYAVKPDAQPKYKELQAAINKDRKKTASLVEAGDPFPWRELFIGPPRDYAKRKPDPKQKQKPAVPASSTARLLGGDSVELAKDVDPRETLMKWMREKDNPWFAKSFVNRIWAAYFNVGIIEPADDLNLANPPSNAPLLDYLAQAFVEHNYDMKWLHREIANSRTYQLSWKPNDTNRLDTRNFSHSIPRRLPAEVTYDAIVQATASVEEMAAFANQPGRRAISQGSFPIKGNRNNNYALVVFGRPARLTNCDCERSNEPSLLQTIYLQNDQEVSTNLQRSGWFTQLERQLNPKPAAQGKQRPGSQQLQGAIAKAEQRLKQLQDAPPADTAAAAKIPEFEQRLKTLREQHAAAVQAEQAVAAAPVAPSAAPAELPAQLIREAYLRTLSRPPTEAELARGLQYVTDSQGTVAGLRDVVWALLNTKEFIVNH